MKLPAIRANIGNWVYYVSAFSFADIAKFVKRIDDELHKSQSLRDEIQRSISENYKSIKSYILTQKEERFFNSIVLAVYDGNPYWSEVELDYDDEQYFNMGFLSLDGTEKIFPVDGQHRVEGIKAALLDEPNLATEKVPIILIGHQKSAAGMEKTRRLFTTLNRYARPVKLNDIIALDEDDTVAIVTRDLLEYFSLFTGNRVNNAEQKAIPESDKHSFTSLITLYQANLELLKNFIITKKQVNPTKTYLLEYLKYRKSIDELGAFRDYCFEFWSNFVNRLDVIKEYMSYELEPARKFRNNVHGGNLLFRPIGLIPFVQALLELHRRAGYSLDELFQRAAAINLQLNTRPWLQVMWNNYDNTMIMGSSALVRLLLIYLINPGHLSNNELKKLRRDYAARISYDIDSDPHLDKVLDGF